MNTREIAEHMLSTSNKYTAASLAAELEITARQASGKLFNIRTSKKYQTEQSKLPNRTVQVTAINGRKLTDSTMWKMVFFRMNHGGVQ